MKKLEVKTLSQEELDDLVMHSQMEVTYANEAGFQDGRESVKEIYDNLDVSTEGIPDTGLPFARVERIKDDGDPSVGMSGFDLIQLAVNQEGTTLKVLLDQNARMKHLLGLIAGDGLIDGVSYEPEIMRILNEE